MILLSSPLSFISGSGGGNRPSPSASAYRDFEDSLCRRLRSLLPLPSPEAVNEAVTLAYLSRAVGVLTSTHTEAAQLLRGHDLTAEGGYLALSAYLDTTPDILKLCNAASAGVDRILRRRLLLAYALQLLADGDRGGISGVWRIERVKKAIVDWEKGDDGEEDQGLKFGNILYRKPFSSSVKEDKYRGAVGSRKIPEFSKALYAVKAVFTVVRGILLAFLCPAAAVIPTAVTLGTSGVPDEFAWAGLYNELQAAISARPGRGHLPLVQELEAVKSRSKDLIETVNNIDTPSAPAATVRALENAVDDLTRGLEAVSESVTGLFRSALHARDAVLQNLHTGLRNCK